MSKTALTSPATALKFSITDNLFGECCTIKINWSPFTWGRNVRRRPDRVTAHVFGVPDPEEISYCGITAQPRYSLKGEDKANDKAWRIYNRAEVSLQRMVIERLVLEGVIPAFFSKFTFSRTAGCSCGCSPGWKGNPLGGYQGGTLYVTVERPSEMKRQAEKKLKQEQEKEAQTLSSMVI